MVESIYNEVKKKYKETFTMKTFIKKLSKTIAGVSAGLILATAGASSVQAIDTSVVDEAWGKPTFVYGGGLSEAEIQQTADLLKIENMNNVASTLATGEDLQKYLEYGSRNSVSMISSVLVQIDNNSCVYVNIITPEYISVITEQQYINAANTEGVQDVNIQVASIRAMPGVSALSGV